MAGGKKWKKDVAPVIPVGASLASDPDDVSRIALMAALHSPIALTLTTLAGTVVYCNIRALKLFDRAAADALGKNLADFCIDAAQIAQIEAVARDGSERQFELVRDFEGIGARVHLCKVSRVAGRAGIPTWIAFAAAEMEPEPAASDAALPPAAVLESYHRVSGCAAWRMKKNHPGQWLNYPVESSRERLLLFNMKQSTSARRARDFLDSVHASDRNKVATAIQSSLDEGLPLEVVYRLVPRLGRSKVILSRGTLIGERDSAEGASLLGFDIDLSTPVEQDLIPVEKAAILDAVAANLDGPVYAVDKQFRLLFFNECFSRVMREQFGLRAVLRARVFHSTAAAARRRTIMSHLRRALSGVSVVEQLLINSKISGSSSFDLMYVPITVESQTTGVVVFGVKCQQRAEAS